MHYRNYNLCHRTLGGVARAELSSTVHLYLDDGLSTNLLSW